MYGSTTGLANGTGAVTGTYTYDVFGAVRAQTGASAQPFRLTGEQHGGKARYEALPPSAVPVGSAHQPARAEGRPADSLR